MNLRLVTVALVGSAALSGCYYYPSPYSYYPRQVVPAASANLETAPAQSYAVPPPGSNQQATQQGAGQPPQQAGQAPQGGYQDQPGPDDYADQPPPDGGYYAPAPAYAVYPTAPAYYGPAIVPSISLGFGFGGGYYGRGGWGHRGRWR